ncbi:MAG: hypothetical protein PVI30_07540 [Myxococcales bacterium]|jgi:hypothetical protein
MAADPHGRAHSQLAVALCAFAYLYAFPYQANLNNPNENVRVYMTAALVEDGTYAIDGPRKRWGWVNDAARKDGHTYSVKAPGTSLLGVPGYALYLGACGLLDRPFDRIEVLWVLRLTASILPSLLALYLFHRWLSRQGHPPALRDAAFFSVALGSNLYAYGMLFVSHTASAIAAFAAFALLHDARGLPGPCRSWRAFAAGFAAAAVTLFEYPGLPCSVVLTLFALGVLWPRGGLRSIAAFAVGGLLPTLAVMHFQWSAFGNPLTPGHLFVESRKFRQAHHEGFYGAVAPNMESLHGLLTDPGAGLFPLTPLLVFGLPGLALLCAKRGRRAEGLCATAICLLTVLAIASMNNWRGGWTVGPRYLALTIPFLAWAALVALDRVARVSEAVSVALALGATAVGMLASGLPSVYYPHLMPAVTRPLPQVLSVLIAHDFAPMNAGNLFGVYGTRSMIPLLLAALAALALCLSSVRARRMRLLLSVGAAVVALCMAVPVLKRPEGYDPDARGALAFITRRWFPEGHDRAARLRAELKRQTTVSDADRRRLARVYAQEGRKREARRALRGNP